MPLTRKLHWDTRALHDFLLSRARTPFRWGENDCATFAADGILAMTGVDVMSELRGYNSADSADAKIGAVTGGSTLQDAVVWCAAKHGLTERQYPLTAQRGDLVLYRYTADSVAAGLVHLSGRHIVSPGETGLQRLPFELVERAWSY